jgi:hypothetical protein
VKPVQHEHVVEVKIPGVLGDNAEKIKAHLEENKKPYVFGLGGVLIGFAASRIFSRPNINIEIITGKE